MAGLSRSGGCTRPAGDSRTNLWGLSVARGKSPVGAEYTDRLPPSGVVFAERNDICGISYPVLNVVGGELFVYYAYYPKAGGNLSMRARLVP